MSSEPIRCSKFLSLVLRHRPEAIGLSLDKNGWADVNDLLEKMNISNKDKPWEHMTFDDLVEVVKTNDKKRFMFNLDETKIRACQGHSINVDLEFDPQKPPHVLYHGTADIFAESIKNEGLKKGKRQFVHLSTNIETAIKIGKRHGNPFLFKVNCFVMDLDGYLFYLSENGVWLTEAVPAKYLTETWERSYTNTRVL